MTPDLSTIPVLETKLYIPKWPAGLVTRARLIERIHAAAARKLTVVSAPAGFGKTTLLAEFLAQRSGGAAPAGWVSLDAGDNDPALFWTCVIRALQKGHPGIGQQALAALRSNSSPTVAVLTSLLNEIEALDRDVVLILDDFHVIETPAIHTAVAFLLDHMPERMHLILATRADPVLPLARMRARGEVTELRASDLRFTSDEAATFLNRVMTLGLATTDVMALEQRTEGWIAGLKLAALSMQSHEDVPAFIRSFSGDNRFVADYLVEEVLQTQPERTRRFLLATSILDRLSAALCDAVTGEPGSQLVLDTLEKSNLFVVALDDRREWYRYHHLFAEVLHTRARREAPALVQEGHRRASTWYEQQGALSDAIHHAQGAHDLERVAKLLEEHWPPKDRSYQSKLWLEQVKSLPSALVQARPLLNMGFAWGLLNAGELEAADQTLRAVEPALADERYPALRREFATARIYLAQSRGDMTGTAEHARQLLELTPEDDHAARATASALLALAQWAGGELNAAHDTFAEALTSMRRAGAELDAIRGEFVLGDIRAAQGRLREAARIYEAGLAHAAAHPGAEADELYLGLSEVHREWNDLAEAERLLHEMEQRAPRAGHASNRHRWGMVMARIAEARGDFDRALTLLAEAEGSVRRDPLPVVRPIAALRARIDIARGDVANAARWDDVRNVDGDGEPSFIHEYEHITRARLYLAQEQLDRAIDLLQRIAVQARTGGRTGVVIETLALQALAHHHLGDTVASLDAIANALELAEPEGFVRVFVDEGLAMRNLLRQAAARGIAGAYTRRVLAGFEEAPSTAQPKGDAAPELLTSREHEILRLIAAGMRNQEIAQQLFISPATVKRHIANVYNKLDAKHRTDALNRAGALNLL